MEFGALRPLGELVPEIAREIKSSASTIRTAAAPSRIIAIPMIAAFVDGNISVEEEKLICEMVQIDNSVLAEVIAAVRSVLERDSDTPLSSELTSRLLAMPGLRSSPPTMDSVTTNGSNIENDPIHEPIWSTPSDRKDSHRSRRISNSKRRLQIGLTFLASLAASLFAMFWFGDFGSAPDPVIPLNIPSEAPTTAQSSMRDSQNAFEPSKTGTNAGPELAHAPAESNTNDSQRVADMENNKNDEFDVPNNTAANADRNKPPLETLKPSESTNTAKAQVSGIRWTKIHGLLAHRFENPVGDATWRSVENGERQWDSADDVGSFELRTLPMSRAEASITTGGRLVLASDTGVQWSRSSLAGTGIMDLLHGQVALVEMPKGTILDLQLGGVRMATLRWESNASIVVSATASALQAQIDAGEVAIDDFVHKNTSVTIAHSMVTEHKERSVRLPSWVARPIDTVSLPKGILAQIASSDNLGNTLGQLIESDVLDEQRLALISAWRTSLTGEGIFRQAAARRPLVRIAVLQRIVHTPEWDPRFGAIWTDMGTAIGDERKVALLRNMAQLVRQGGKPSPLQVNALLVVLESPDTASRSLGDYLLRQFYGGGPPFDPTWTGDPGVRGVGLWRRFIANISTNR